jgi:hypothetical protein
MRLLHIQVLDGYISFPLVLPKRAGPPLLPFASALLRFNAFCWETVRIGNCVLRSAEVTAVKVGIMAVEEVTICLSCLLKVYDRFEFRVS